jgi:Flp pilus assembly protein TadG
MKRFGLSFLCRFLKDQSGQTGIMAVVTITTIMGLAAAGVETGHVYYAYQQLVTSTNAAALAGAVAMPNTTNAATNVARYSAQTGELNATNLLQNVSATPSDLCLSTVSNSLNVPCSTSTGATGGYNALSVTQTATIPLWFGGLIGMSKLNVSATATAAMRGGANSPWNIALIIDTTSSMGSSDSGAQCTGTRESCALLGVQALLNDLYPCALGQTCNSTPAPPPVDSVSLFVFPAVTTATMSKDYVCNTSNPTIVAYTFPAPPSSLTLPTGDTYSIIGFSNNYKTTDTATSLNQAAAMVIAAGDSGVSGCSGLQTPGGEGTYYAQAIYAAQSALSVQQGLNPGSQNAMIILTDGDATACATNAYTTGGACNTKSQLVASAGTLNGTGTSSTNPTGYKSYAYPSALGECGQAVLAAQAAANAGTVVYTIGYGSPTSGGCATDKTYSTTTTTNGGSWSPGKQPCAALAAMASAQVNFYSDDAAGCQATAPSNQSLTKLTAIFRAITNNLSTPRLIPNGTT